MRRDPSRRSICTDSSNRSIRSCRPMGAPWQCCASCATSRPIAYVPNCGWSRQRAESGVCWWARIARRAQLAGRPTVNRSPSSARRGRVLNCCGCRRRTVACRSSPRSLNRRGVFRGHRMGDASPTWHWWSANPRNSMPCLPSPMARSGRICRALCVITPTARMARGGWCPATCSYSYSSLAADSSVK